MVHKTSIRQFCLNDVVWMTHSFRLSIILPSLMMEHLRHLITRYERVSRPRFFSTLVPRVRVYVRVRSRIGVRNVLDRNKRGRNFASRPFDPCAQIGSKSRSWVSVFEGSLPVAKDKKTKSRLFTNVFAHHGCHFNSLSDLQTKVLFELRLT